MNFVAQYLTQQGVKKYRIDQVNQAIYRDFVFDFSQMTTLPQDMREDLQENLIFPLEVMKERVSKDKTQKILFKANDGKMIESVLMRHLHERNTVCVSSQVGCAMACTFCATGKMGITRNLTADEIVMQVVYFQKKMANEGQRIRNVVFMGMGEPLNNYENVMEAVRVLNDQKKCAIGIRHLTISTCGVVPMIEKLIKDPLKMNLAISLHAPNDKLRSSIMPINDAFPLAELMKVLRKYQAVTNNRIFYEYVLLKGVNDSLENAAELGKLLQGTNAHVNLIPYNPGADDAYEAPANNANRRFQKAIEEFGVPVTVRVTFGQDIDGACGQLALKS
ncbi:23S rRNA (adenine(2503)-C(2))-methyltransferase RlmN [Candidatus Peregrinibacteria bacterium]|nr:MAG: 23S rRNA (adenine(2503)-C(2))-methyltransferase RlmN [Candidatus Peregrinibacteria bacterium]